MPNLSDTPAGRIISMFGGITLAARAWKKPKSTVQRWKDSGFIHPHYFPEILDAAVEEHVVLDVRDFNPVDIDHPAFGGLSNSGDRNDTISSDQNQGAHRARSP